MALTVNPLRSQERLNLIVVEGEGAINNIRPRTARETIVQVEDENRKPVGGAVVVFTLPRQGAGGTFASLAQTLTLTTDAEGRAVAQGLRVNRVGGQWQMRVNASLGNRTGSVTVTQTNVATAAGAVATTRGGGGLSPAAAPTTISAGGGTVGHP
jgi:hypothetical protein